MRSARLPIIRSYRAEWPVVGVHYQIASVMIKPSGISEAIIIPDLSKSEMDAMVRILALAIADNSVSGTSL